MSWFRQSTGRYTVGAVWAPLVKSPLRRTCGPYWPVTRSQYCSVPTIGMLLLTSILFALAMVHLVLDPEIVEQVAGLLVQQLGLAEPRDCFPVLRAGVDVAVD